MSVLTALLDKAPYRCSGVLSAADCLTHLQSREVDLVLADVIMPGMSGIDLCHAIKTAPEYAHIDVILISGHAVSPEEKAFGLETGASDYISRPVNNRELLARIKAVQRHRSSGVNRRRTEPYSLLDTSATENTQDMYSQQRIEKAFPDEFDRFVARYAECMQRAIESVIYKTDNTDSAKVRELARDLGFYMASARDVVDIHKKALLIMLPGNNARKSFYVHNEGRIQLVELMGFLLNYYRNRC